MTQFLASWGKTQFPSQKKNILSQDFASGKSDWFYHIRGSNWWMTWHWPALPLLLMLTLQPSILSPPCPSLTINDKYYITDDRFCHKHWHRFAFTGCCKYFMTHQVRWYSCFLGAEYSITSFISLLCDYWEISEMSPIFSYFAAEPCPGVPNICFRLSEDSRQEYNWVLSHWPDNCVFCPTKLKYHSPLSRERQRANPTLSTLCLCAPVTFSP